MEEIVTGAWLGLKRNWIFPFSRNCESLSNLAKIREVAVFQKLGEKRPDNFAQSCFLNMQSVSPRKFLKMGILCFNLDVIPSILGR
jgi:hypothetical protein